MFWSTKPPVPPRTSVKPETFIAVRQSEDSYSRLYPRPPIVRNSLVDIAKAIANEYDPQNYVVYRAEKIEINLEVSITESSS